MNDQNFCDENPTAAVTRNVFVNDVRLIQNTLTPGSGDEPGLRRVPRTTGTSQGISEGSGGRQSLMRWFSGNSAGIAIAPRALANTSARVCFGRLTESPD